MPELPEVQSLKKYFEREFVCKKVTGLKVVNKKILGNVSEKNLKQNLIGSVFKSASRHGKYLFMESSYRCFLVFHFGMTGSLKCFKSQSEIPSYSRFILSFFDNSKLAFRCIRMLGKIYFTDSVENFVKVKRLGPDALGIKRNEFFRLMGSRRGRIKPVLLDQSFIAGIGNIYADEILFQSGIHPETKVDLLGSRKMGKIYNYMKKVLKTAINLESEIERYPELYISKNRNKSGRCPRCGTRIKRINISGRGAYFCPRCQEG